MAKFRTKTVQLTDERVKYVSELIPAMRVVKMYTWETSFVKLINSIRKSETAMLFKSLFLYGVAITLIYCLGPFSAFLSLTIYALNGYILTSSVVFMTITIMFLLAIVVSYGSAQGN